MAASVLVFRGLRRGVAPADREAVAAALGQLTSRRTLRLRRAAYTNLLSTGELRLIRNAALRDSIELNRTLGDDPALAAGLAVLGQVLVERGERAEGLRVLRESLLTWNAAHMPAEAAQTRALIAEIKAAEAEPPPSA